MSSNNVENKAEPTSEVDNAESTAKTEADSGAESVSEKSETAVETLPPKESKKESADTESTVDEKPPKDEEGVEEKSDSIAEEANFSFEDVKSENNIEQASEADSNISSQSNDIGNETSSPKINNVNSDEIKSEKKSDSPAPLSNGDVKSHGKENEKNNVLSDDLIFVKPKDKDRGHCYCGKDRNLNIVELLCANCNRWFHESCIGYQLGKLVPFMLNYVFLCKNCSPSGLEIFKKNQSTTTQLCVTAIGNLIQSSIKEGKPKKYFSKDKDIIPFIDSHWEGMTTTARRVTQSWHSTVLRTLTKDCTLFRTCTDSVENTFGLFNHDVTQIKPNYEAMLKGGHLKMTDMGVQPVGGAVQRRGAAKRKAPGEGSSIGIGKRGRVDTAPVKLSAHGYPLEHPYNKEGYRYFLAEPDPNAPFRQEFDESSESAGKPIPGWLYRSLCPNSVLLALHDRAPQLRVSEDRLSIVGEKGYCMARATHYVSRGMWYYEVNVDEMKDGSACRIGWGQSFANLQTPLGFDKFGYCWRSRKGTKFHEARGKHYSSGFGEGDTLGLLICLPDTKSGAVIPPTFKDRPLVKFKSHLYYEEKDNLTEISKSLTPLKGSKIIFFKNGECQGEAFLDIYEGQYYPTVSLYKPCVLSLNFGPEFKHPPSKDQFHYRPMFERAEETICEQTLSDVVYLTENEGKLKLDL
ncbi:set1/Ash2 histone methyltransferase complex subunit ASH2 [Planococcus citri]|uniref:set1/Ash2 histone methyltransferase complex subunit ASH2 n=1 Tax=Planococcus citri TaxID=170843 RepID=UPI0031F77AF3